MRDNADAQKKRVNSIKLRFEMLQTLISEYSVALI